MASEKLSAEDLEAKCCELELQLGEARQEVAALEAQTKTAKAQEAKVQLELNMYRLALRTLRQFEEATQSTGLPSTGLWLPSLRERKLESVAEDAEENTVSSPKVVGLVASPCKSAKNRSSPPEVHEALASGGTSHSSWECPGVTVQPEQISKVESKTVERSAVVGAGIKSTSPEPPKLAVPLPISPHQPAPATSFRFSAAAPIFVPRASQVLVSTTVRQAPLIYPNRATTWNRAVYYPGVWQYQTRSSYQASPVVLQSYGVPVYGNLQRMHRRS